MLLLVLIKAAFLSQNTTVCCWSWYCMHVCNTLLCILCVGNSLMLCMLSKIEATVQCLVKYVTEYAESSYLRVFWWYQSSHASRLERGHAMVTECMYMNNDSNSQWLGIPISNLWDSTALVVHKTLRADSFLSTQTLFFALCADSINIKLWTQVNTSNMFQSFQF